MKCKYKFIFLKLSSMQQPFYANTKFELWGTHEHTQSPYDDSLKWHIEEQENLFLQIYKREFKFKRLFIAYKYGIRISGSNPTTWVHILKIKWYFLSKSAQNYLNATFLEYLTTMNSLCRINDTFKHHFICNHYTIARCSQIYIVLEWG